AAGTCGTWQHKADNAPECAVALPQFLLGDVGWSLSISGDGRRVVMGGRRGASGQAQVWDVATAQPIGERMYHPNQITTVAYHPKLPVVMTGGEDATVRFWDADTGKPLGEPLKHGLPVWVVAFSPDGERFVTGDGDI